MCHNEIECKNTTKNFSNERAAKFVMFVYKRTNFLVEKNADFQNGDTNRKLILTKCSKCFLFAIKCAEIAVGQQNLTQLVSSF